MNRLLIVAAGVVGACAIAVPAAAGLSGNPSFSQRIPVRVPASASVVTFDDHGRAVEAEARHSSRPSPTASAMPTATHTEPDNDRPDNDGPGDDNDHRRGHGTHTEPGDDRSSSTHVEPGDDKSSSSPAKHRGADDGAQHHRRHGHDDAGHGSDG